MMILGSFSPETHSLTSVRSAGRWLGGGGGGGGGGEEGDGGACMLHGVLTVSSGC